MRLVAPRLFFRMCGLSVVVVLLDQVSKFLVFRVLMMMRRQPAVRIAAKARGPWSLICPVLASGAIAPST